MNRLQQQLEENKAAGKKSFIGYLTAGDPDLGQLPELLKALEDGGCDVIEIGVPYSDPLADGPVIQAAGQRSIEKGTSIYTIFDCLETCRASIDVPLVFLVYYNTLVIHGVEAFVKRCEAVGIDGLIIPDLPYEEQKEILDVLNQDKTALIPFATPTSKERMTFTLQQGSGFVYTVSSMGVTGRASDFHEEIEAYMEEVRAYSPLPVAIGFGISTPEDVRRMRPLADAVIVGSAIVTKIHESGGDAEQLRAYVQTLVEA